MREKSTSSVRGAGKSAPGALGPGVGPRSLAIVGHTHTYAQQFALVLVLCKNHGVFAAALSVCVQVRTCLAAARKDGKPLAEAAAPFNYSTKRLLSKYMEQVKEEAGEESYSALFDSPFAFFCPGLEGAEADPKNPQYKKAKI